MTGVIDDALAAKGLAPARHYLDSGYLSAALVVEEAARHGIALIGPLLADTSAQARAGTATPAPTSPSTTTPGVTCPQGKTRVVLVAVHADGARTRSWRTFSPGDCGPCPARELCTRQDETPPAHHPAP